ncbi:MAG: ATP-dependent helicase Lhr and Lhr-like helicase, partial [Pseudonocardiales bacterium]|nr:ATP-dependent helicase Lhr and Lhr-like helicase [Pseudonocardiales bacterium]
GTEWCDADVLRMLRRRSLAALRREVEPVPPVVLARFLPSWQGTGGQLRGSEGVLHTIETLRGAAVPASVLERLVLPARVAAYSPAMLDELTVAGEVVWWGNGSLPGGDGWVCLATTDDVPLLLAARPDGEAGESDPVETAILDALAGGNALFFRQLVERLSEVDHQGVSDALWRLVWAGRVSNDTMAALRSHLGPAARRRPTRQRYARPGRPSLPHRSTPTDTGGRWWAMPEPDPDATRRAHATVGALLDRHGVLTRGAVVSEHIPGGFAAAYRMLSAMEDSGRIRRGYFVEGLGAAQFAATTTVDRLRTFETASAERPSTVVLAATDPANPYGAALAWPERAGENGGHRPGRKAGALVVLVDGELTVYVERGGRTLLSWSDDLDVLQRAVDALALAGRDGWLGRLSVERTDGVATVTDLETPLARALAEAGFRATPRGLRLRH